MVEVEVEVEVGQHVCALTSMPIHGRAYLHGYLLTIGPSCRPSSDRYVSECSLRGGGSGRMRESFSYPLPLAKQPIEKLSTKCHNAA